MAYSGEEAVTCVRSLLEDCAAGFAAACRARPGHPRDAERHPSLDVGRRGVCEDEAEAFLRTVDEGLVQVDPDGRFVLPGSRLCSSNLHLVGRSENGVVLHTEYLIQIGAFGELVLDHGWERARLSFERGEFDLWGHDETDRIVLAVEAKARAFRPTSDSLETLRDSFFLLAEQPDVLVPKNHSRKWHELARFTRSGPVAVWLVADGARWLFEARRVGDRVKFVEKGGPPTPSRCVAEG